MKIPLLLTLVGVSCSICQAQPIAQVPAPIANGAALPEPKKQTFKFTLKNIKPSMMAYWLDPASHTAPLEFRTSTPALPQGNVGQQGIFRLPQGVDRIVAVDPQNALLVFGTAQGANELAQTINFLDRPLRKVELEAKFVHLDNKDLNAIFGYTPPNIKPEGVQFWRVRDGFAAILDALTKSDKAKVLSAPRVLAINNLTAEINQSTSTPVRLQADNGTTNGLALPERASLLLETSRSLSVTPTINNDDTVTVLAHISESVQLKNSANAQDALVLQKSGDGPDIIVNVRDGDTIAVDISSKPSSPASSQITVMFLTTRIVRQAAN